MGFSTTKHTIQNMANEAEKALFAKIRREQQGLYELLPTLKAYHCLILEGHFELFSCTLELHKKKSFMPQCLFKFL